MSWAGTKRSPLSHGSPGGTACREGRSPCPRNFDRCSRGIWSALSFLISRLERSHDRPFAAQLKASMTGTSDCDQQSRRCWRSRARGEIGPNAGQIRPKLEAHPARPMTEALIRNKGGLVGNSRLPANFRNSRFSIAENALLAGEAFLLVFRFAAPGVVYRYATRVLRPGR